MTSAGQGRSGRLRHTVDMLIVLAISDLRIRYGRGGIRTLKWLLDPFAALGVYLVLIVFVLNESPQAVGLSLVCAIVPFQLVLMSSQNAFKAIDLRGPVIANMAFPRTLIPVSSVVTESITTSASFILLPLMMIVYGVAPTTAILWLPLALAVTLLFSLALAYPSALIGVWYPEFQSFAVSLIRTLFFVAPGLVALDQITGTTRELLPINPLTGLFEAFRDALLYGQPPAAWELLVPLGFVAVLLPLGYWVFHRDEASLAKLVGG